MSTTMVVKRAGQAIGSVLIAQVVLLMAGCKVGPDYKRPAVNVPGNYRQAIAPDIAPTSQTSIADEQWRVVFQDPKLQNLIEDALASNLDLRMAGAAGA
jgi:multidrug efflux system outer membrane protein